MRHSRDTQEQTEQIVRAAIATRPEVLTWSMRRLRKYIREQGDIPVGRGWLAKRAPDWGFKVAPEHPRASPVELVPWVDILRTHAGRVHGFAVFGSERFKEFRGWFGGARADMGPSLLTPSPASYDRLVVAEFIAEVEAKAAVAEPDIEAVKRAFIDEGNAKSVLVLHTQGAEESFEWDEEHGIASLRSPSFGGSLMKIMMHPDLAWLGMGFFPTASLLVAAIRVAGEAVVATPEEERMHQIAEALRLRAAVAKKIGDCGLASVGCRFEGSKPVSLRLMSRRLLHAGRRPCGHQRPQPLAPVVSRCARPRDEATGTVLEVSGEHLRNCLIELAVSGELGRRWNAILHAQQAVLAAHEGNPLVGCARLVADKENWGEGLGGLFTNVGRLPREKQRERTLLAAFMVFCLDARWLVKLLQTHPTKTFNSLRSDLEVNIYSSLSSDEDIVSRGGDHMRDFSVQETIFTIVSALQHRSSVVARTIRENSRGIVEILKRPMDIREAERVVVDERLRPLLDWPDFKILAQSCRHKFLKLASWRNLDHARKSFPSVSDESSASGAFGDGLGDRDEERRAGLVEVLSLLREDAPCARDEVVRFMKEECRANEAGRRRLGSEVDALSDGDKVLKATVLGIWDEEIRLDSTERLGRRAS